jgi:hypothetical protein
MKEGLLSACVHSCLSICLYIPTYFFLGVLLCHLDVCMHILVCIDLNFDKNLMRTYKGQTRPLVRKTGKRQHNKFQTQSLQKEAVSHMCA